MKLTQLKADLYVLNSTDAESAIERTTHLGIGAHQDDLEFMSLQGILECFQQENRWYGGIVCTDGAGSARTGPYVNYSDDQMQTVRLKEQQKAATIGDYSFVAQLGFSSSASRNPGERKAMVADLVNLLTIARPEVVYTHNPFDKHATHIGVFLATLAAIRELPEDDRPRQLIGCEVWRSLDWLPDKLKVVQPVSTHPNLAASLNGIFDSQIAGGKRYDLAVEGRRLANATFFDAHSIDKHDRVAYGIDLTSLTQQDGPCVEEFVRMVLNDFSSECSQLLGDLK
jgi:LmbE family N-acetylglucosaminyl deacetylase